MKYYIYGLFSTEDNVIRYVGQTKSNLNQRKNEHKCDAITKKIKNHKCNWIRSVYKRGFEIGITLIEETDENNWANREVYWINYLKSKNKLVNELKGGNCGGIGGKLVNYLPYKEAKIFVKNNFRNAISEIEYKKEYSERKSEFLGIVPKNPHHVYSLRGEWIGWGDYLSTNKISDIKKHESFLPFDDTVKIIKVLKLKTKKEYRKIDGVGKLYPLNPDRTYKKEWKGWYYFLNGEYEELPFNYDEFCKYIKDNFGELPSCTEYSRLYKNGVISKRAYSHPSRKYKKSFIEIRNDIKNL